jgi:WD40 repeat protein/uncharacterized caspase-like protein
MRVWTRLLLVVACLFPGRSLAQQAQPELVVQSGHVRGIFAMAVSPDGTRIASGGGFDGSIRLWDTSTWLQVRVFTGGGHEWVNSLAFHPGGRFLASGHQSGGLRIWDVAAGRMTRQLRPEGGVVNQVVVAYSPDGKLLASAHRDGSVVLWDPVSGQSLRVIRVDVGEPRSLVFTPDGEMLAAGGPSGVALVETKTGRTVRTFSGETTRSGYAIPAQGTGLDVSPDGRLVAAGGEGDVFVWDLASGSRRQVLQNPSARVVHSVKFSPNGRWVAAGNNSGTAALWEVATGERRGSVAHGDQVRSVAFSPKGDWLASAGLDSVITISAVPGGSQVRRIGGSSASPRVVAFSADGHWLGVGGAADFEQGDGALRVWDARDGQLVHAWASPYVYGVRHVEFVGANEVVAQHSERETIWRWELGSGKELKPFPDPARDFAVSADGRWLAIAPPRDSPADEGNIRVRDLTTNAVRSTLASSRLDRPLALSPDGHWLAAGALWLSRNNVKIWDVTSGQLVQTLECGYDPLTSVAFSANGRILAASCEAVKLWDVAAWRELPAPKRATDAWALSPDARWLAMARRLDPAITLVEIGTGVTRTTLTGHTAGVVGLSFNASGSLLVSASADGSTRIWDVNAGKEVAAIGVERGSAEWVVVTPEGFFDGSPTGIRDLVAWRFGSETVPLELFFNEFYYPGLLADVLAGRAPKAARSLAQLDRRQPRVQLAPAPSDGPKPLETSARVVRLRIEVAEAPPDPAHPAASGARDVRLFRNGSLVKIWHGDVASDRAGHAILEAEVPVTAGQNRFTAYAFNRDNIKSGDATLVVVGAPTLKRPRTAHVLAVGINQYSNPDYNLAFSVPDAKLFADELSRQQSTLGNFERVEVVTLLDKEATRANILAALARLAGQDTSDSAGPPALGKLEPAQPEDAVFVYYAGHGVARGPRFYLIPHDMGYDGVIGGVDDAGWKTLVAHGISDLDLEQAFEKIDAERLVLIVDACQSGQALEADEKRRGPMNSKGLAQLAYEKGMYVLAAAQGFQSAVEVAELGHGILTYALVEEGLKTGAADTAPADGQVLLREWLDYSVVRVPQMQQAAMQQARKVGREIAFVDGEQKITDLGKRSLQRPRVFYRREPEAAPLVVAKPRPKQ